MLQALHVGDRVVSVDGAPVATLDELTAAVERGSSSDCSTVVLQVLRRRPRPEYESAAARDFDDGVERLCMVLAWRPNGPRLGLAIKQLNGAIVVSRCTDGSLAAAVLVPGDVIESVEGAPVTDRDHTKEAIVERLANVGAVELRIVRVHGAHVTDDDGVIDAARVARGARGPRHSSIEIISSGHESSGLKSILKKPSTSSVPAYLLQVLLFVTLVYIMHCRAVTYFA